MGQALYRKYRSRKLSEVVGQDHITKTLASALKQNKISHAYLFSGPRGVGKTSVARIMAHEVNQLPYKDDSPHLDIIEIDAASNRRIDEIRDLRQKINVMPALAKYKVYVIDEVHMLTREAFNALLKTLEEPPQHAIFILATTEAHKLPETIVSRTQHFSFKPVAKPAVADHLKQIAESEKISIDDGALELLAEYGEGSFRDSIGLLDQLDASSRKINEKAVRDLIGLPSKQAVAELLKAVIAAQPKTALQLLNQLLSDGSNATTLATEIGRQLRQLIIESRLDKWAIKLLKTSSKLA
jgi:DNA polymerase-3 subunit gamma/tau